MARAPENAPIYLAQGFCVAQGFGVAQDLLSDDVLSEASTFCYRLM